MRVPLIFFMAGHFLENKKSDALVEMMDLSATLLELANCSSSRLFSGEKSGIHSLWNSDGNDHREFVRSEYFDALDPHFTGGDGTMPQCTAPNPTNYASTMVRSWGIVRHEEGSMGTP
ncbi:MAG: hypothetical protein CM15mP130_1870 [Verrucomicrobiota bacterium]|nr:MAG: hypothetical protein CM15mP130_1870 [Verrucomicrobiota bacterium]